MVRRVVYVLITTTVALGVAWLSGSASSENPSSDVPAADEQRSVLDEPTEDVAEPSSEPVADTQPTEPALGRSQLFGTWRQEYHVERLLTLNEDGTGLLVIRPLTTSQRFLLGEELRIDMEWTLDDRTVTLITLGGTPKKKVEWAMKLFAVEKVKEKTIEEATPEKLTIRDPSDGELEPPLMRHPVE